MPRNIIADHFAAMWQNEHKCQLYVENAAAIDRLRVAELAAAGLPDTVIAALWGSHEHLKQRADDFAACGLDYLDHALMFVVDVESGEIVEYWEASDPWEEVAGRLRGVTDAA